MIHTSRRPRGARSLVVITSAALLGLAPLLGPAHKASADGPVRPRAGHYLVPTHRFARPRGFSRPGGLSRPGGRAHRIRRHVQTQVARVSIDTRAPVAPILPGKVYNWPFVVKNRSPVQADSVTFAAPLPGSLQFVSAQQNCSFKDNAAVCQLGSLKPGESKSGVVTAMVGDNAPGGQPIDSNALVKWQSTPAAKEGQTTAAFPEVEVADTADVSVVKAAPAVVQPGQRVPYQITVANHGPTAAKNVRLTSASVPVLAHASQDCAGPAAPRGGQEVGQSGGQEAGQTSGQEGGQSRDQLGGQEGGQLGAPGSGHNADAPGLVCDIGTLKPGETRAIKINAEARKELKPGTVIQAPSHVSTSTIETDLSNNQADALTKVEAAPVVQRVVPRSVPGTTSGLPNAGSGLPNTGAPTRELLHVVVVLVGMGLIFHRIGRSRRRARSGRSRGAGGPDGPGRGPEPTTTPAPLAVAGTG